jgi:hypothetical protein
VIVSARFLTRRVYRELGLQLRNKNAQRPVEAQRRQAKPRRAQILAAASNRSRRSITA